MAALFWATGGRWWKDKKGYHARCGSLNKGALLVIQEALGGKVSFRPMRKAQGYWQWTAQRKSVVEWLDRNLGNLFLPALPVPDRSTCRHCGGQDGYHEQECQEAPGE